jgi:hypothetical protein
VNLRIDLVASKNVPMGITVSCEHLSKMYPITKRSLSRPLSPGALLRIIIRDFQEQTNCECTKLWDKMLNG